MDLKEIKEIIDIMKKSELTEFAIEEDGFKLHLKRAGETVAPVQYAPQPQMPAMPPPAPQPSGSGGAPAGEPAEEKGVAYIRSPMVGTFYRAPSPESPPYIDLKDVVSAETVVCIIEAMKVMNEIQAETSGIVTEVLVENGESVEYNQPLFKLKVS